MPSPSSAPRSASGPAYYLIASAIELLLLAAVIYHACSLQPSAPHPK